MSYSIVQSIYQQRYGKTVKTCWIADIKRLHGCIMCIAPNRIRAKPKHPCPESVRPYLEGILKELGII